MYSHRFWEDALQHGVIGQLKLTEAVVWDELSPEELHEAITGKACVVGRVCTISSPNSVFCSRAEYYFWAVGSNGVYNA